jgi:hypothetical protein
MQVYQQMNINTVTLFTIITFLFLFINANFEDLFKVKKENEEFSLYCHCLLRKNFKTCDKIRLMIIGYGQSNP